jgi:hypothetical protein
MKKFKLDDLKVKSFVLTTNQQQISGGRVPFTKGADCVGIED